MKTKISAFSEKEFTFVSNDVTNLIDFKATGLTADKAFKTFPSSTKRYLRRAGFTVTGAVILSRTEIGQGKIQKAS